MLMNSSVIARIIIGLWDDLPYEMRRPLDDSKIIYSLTLSEKLET